MSITDNIEAVKQARASREAFMFKYINSYGYNPYNSLDAIMDMAVMGDDYLYIMSEGQYS